MKWSVEQLDSVVDDELNALPTDMRARYTWISNLIEEHGLHNVRAPHVDHIQDKLWEMRLKGKAEIARALYVTAQTHRAVVVRVFVKKTRKTPNSEIKLALERAKRVKDDEA
jgi:phage-related protein